MRTCSTTGWRDPVRTTILCSTVSTTKQGRTSQPCLNSGHPGLCSSNLCAQQTGSHCRDLSLLTSSAWRAISSNIESTHWRLYLCKRSEKQFSTSSRMPMFHLVSTFSWRSLSAKNDWWAKRRARGWTKRKLAHTPSINSGIRKVHQVADSISIFSTVCCAQGRHWPQRWNDTSINDGAGMGRLKLFFSYYLQILSYCAPFDRELLSVANFFLSYPA